MTTLPQPAPDERREDYLAALLAADPYALVQRRDDRTRLADAVMKVADAEIAAVLNAAADQIDSTPDISAAVHATTELRRIAARVQAALDADAKDRR
ncbi:hypothetical protein AQJ30_15765 [Streptomyces longwoodensis]|uniref:Uncharacterized protein n=1 Tax=Streptomyces longwoodensis TaxID=68231 RepID=A0A117QN99_9ACTN|nr:hypothetical protein [Streptomyces longwoodensis]KUN37739.1 hypothetical protein AQJ30_15765 [Streptomyces longwoodensis]